MLARSKRANEQFAFLRPTSSPQGKLKRNFPRLFIAALITIGFTSVLQATTVTYAASHLSGSQWRYDYTISGSYTTGEDLAIYFPYATNSGLTDLSTGGADWTTYVLQPDPTLSANGEFDILANVSNPSLTPTFSVSFLYSGTGAPGAQDFTLFDPSFTVLQAGTTSAVPEPNSLALLGVAIVLACALRWVARFRRARYKQLGISGSFLLALLLTNAVLYGQGRGGPGTGGPSPGGAGWWRHNKYTPLRL